MFKCLKFSFSKKNIFFKTYYKMERGYFKIETNKNDIILTPNEGYDSVLIFLHGLGDSAIGYRDFFDSKYKPIPDRMKVVLLTAPQAAVTINGGMVMNSWYDIKTFTRSDDSIEKADVVKNGSQIKKCVEEEAKALGGNYSKVFLGGFSQGACMSLHVGLTMEDKLGGLVALSGLLFPFTAKEIVSSERNRDINMFIAHGAYDDVIPELLAKSSYKTIFDLKYKNVVYKSYEIQHTIDMDEMIDIKNFLTKLI